jgi:hypothetical protein
MVLPTSRYRRLLRLVLAPFWAGLGAALSSAVPPAGLLLVPLGAARLGRAAMAAPTSAEALATVTLAPAAALLLGALAAGVGGASAAILAVALFSLPALALLAAARDGRRQDDVVLVVASAAGIGLLSVLLGVLVSGTDPGPWLAGQLLEKLPEIVGYYRSAGWDEVTIEAASRVLRLAGELLSTQLPGLLLAGSVLFGCALVYPLGRLWGAEAQDLGNRSYALFSTPVWAAVAFVPAGLGAALASGPARHAAVDLLLPLAALFFLRGLAIIRALLDRGRAGPLLRALVYLVVFQMPLPFVLAFGGLLDEFVDVRGRMNRWTSTRGAGGPPRP